jgi:hypothetical protein
MPRFLKIPLVVLALHLIVLSFFFFKPESKYLMVIVLSTITVWPFAFYLDKSGKWTTILAGSLVQLFVQQIAFHSWAQNVAPLWPFLQFVSVQYIVAWRLSSPEG